MIDVINYIKENPNLYEPNLQKKIRYLLKWIEYDHEKKLTTHPEELIMLAKRITLPPKRPKFRNIIPNWKIRFTRFLVGYKRIQPPISW